MDFSQPPEIVAAALAKELHLPPAGVARTIALLDEGNTVPFITRFRKDQTGGLDEEPVRRIQERVQRLRMLRERQETILKTIEGQGKLTPELAAEIKSAQSIKRVEDLYLPYKPKKQSLATLARQRGLEPLAREIFEADVAAADLDKRAADFVNPDNQLPNVAEVLLGVGHLIAERISEKAEVRGPLRRIMRQSGKLVCSQIEPPAAPAAAAATTAASQAPAATGLEPAGLAVAAEEGVPMLADAVTDAPSDAGEHSLPEEHGEEHTVDGLAGEDHPTEEAEDSAEEHAHDEAAETEADEGDEETSGPVASETGVETGPSAETLPAGEAGEVSAAPAEGATATGTEGGPGQAQVHPPAHEGQRAPMTPKATAASKIEKRKKQKEIAAYKDYFQFREAISRVPPHRVLAINRGERARVLRVRVEADADAMEREGLSILLEKSHPHYAFLAECIRDGLVRFVIPSLEREVRRELSEQAEQHAVEVFARNLRKLLLQPPVRGRRVLALDPGYRSGCKLAAVDQFGNMLGHGVIPVVGNEERRKRGRQKLAEMIRQYDVTVAAIGNGAACRETEQLVAQTIAEEFREREIAYCFVNEAGASVYSTSPVGREELPQYDATVRSAISIGRRLLDPLSELVKINPANIGVGLYQHDVKGKHLQSTLDAVVESCVNFVGVDVNTASPALLRHVSGLNQLTARKIFEYRQEHGPFRNREAFQQVSGIGQASYIQAAGFLRIVGGDNPLDATWIHPESYDVARRVLAKIGASEDDLARCLHRPAPPPVVAAVSEPAAAASSETLASPTVPAETAPQETQGSQAESPASVTEAVGPSPVSEAGAPPSAAVEVPVNVEQTAGDAAEATVPVAAATPPIPSGPTPEEIAREELQRKVNAANVDQLAAELGIGRLLLVDLLAALTSLGRDPREDLPPPVFRREIMKLEDLRPGMELAGTVLNVVDFGAFVDIGLADSGLVHISRLIDRFIKDPHEVVGVGDVLKVWVVEVDKDRRRVSLTAIQPGSERTAEQRAAERAAARASRPPAPKPQRSQRPRGDDSRRGQGSGQRSGPRRDEGAGSDRRRREAPPPAAIPVRLEDRLRGGYREPSRVVRQGKQQPKEVKPISKAMRDGREPLRSFSDLAQYLGKKEEVKEEKEKKE